MYANTSAMRESATVPTFKRWTKAVTALTPLRLHLQRLPPHPAQQIQPSILSSVAVCRSLRHLQAAKRVTRAHPTAPASAVYPSTTTVRTAGLVVIYVNTSATKGRAIAPIYNISTKADIVSISPARHLLLPQASHAPLGRSGMPRLGNVQT